jgi:hypothetical protein
LGVSTIEPHRDDTAYGFQRWGGPIQEIRPGDAVWFAPGLKHWHGATPTTAMTHIRHSGSGGRQECRLDGKGQTSNTASETAASW